MTRHTTIYAMSLVALTLLACKPRDDVREEVKELQQAQQAAPEKAQQLQRELEGAKAHVAQLENKLALAKQGVTDDVLRQRQELERTVKQSGRRVDDQLKQVQGAANQHNEDVQNAQKALEQTQPAGQVETRVKTETRVTPSEKNTDVVHERREVGIDRTHTVEGQEQQPQGNQ